MSDRNEIDFSMFLDAYLSDTAEGFQKSNAALLILEKDYTRLEQLDEVFRNLHTLKSSSAMLEFADIAQLAHVGENLLDSLRKRKLPITPASIDVLFEVLDVLEMMAKTRAARKEGAGAEWVTRISELKTRIAAQERGSPGEKDGEDVTTAVSRPSASSVSTANPAPTIEKIQTVRVNVELLDSLFNLVGEITITKNRIDSIVSGVAEKDLKAALAAMQRLISQLQEDVSAARLVPVNEIFQKYPRMVRDLARDAGKEIEFAIEGGDLELDKATLDTLSEPLIHLLRNAVGHGIEDAETRQRTRKRKVGTIKLAARRAENLVLIVVEDDGSGVDIKRVKEAIVAQGRMKTEEVESLGQNDVLKLLFEAGLTTTKGVTDLAGRGVGLDVVRAAVKSLGGRIDVATEKGKGTSFTLKLPLSTTVMQTLMVRVGRHFFAIPSDIVIETFEVKPREVRQILKERALVLRQEVIPFAMLNDVLNLPQDEEHKSLAAVLTQEALALPSDVHEEGLIAIITRWESRALALGVDSLIDQRESIVKRLDHITGQFSGLSGGIILGDGSVALLLDIPSLFDEIESK